MGVGHQRFDIVNLLSHKVIGLIGFYLILIQSDAYQALCPPHWRNNGQAGTCIKVYNEAKSWQDARDVCQGGAGDLLQILTHRVSIFLYRVIQKDRKLTYWIGLNDRREEGKYRWLDEEEEATYTPWSEPPLAERHCAEIGNRRSSYETNLTRQWGATICDALAKFICELTAEPCPSEWIRSEESGTCVRLHGEQETWTDARVVCRAAGGDLVKIKTEAMDDFIWSLISEVNSLSYWIGLNYYRRTRRFRFLDDDKQLLYTPWGENEPAVGSRRSLCGEIGRANKSRWTAVPCSTNAKFICEKPAALCRRGWFGSRHSGTCIKLHRGKLTWEDSRAVCQAAGGDFVSVTDAKMYRETWGRVGARDTSLYWTGLKINMDWLDRESETKSEPWREQACGEIQYNPAREWSVGHCGDKHKYICETLPESCPSGWLRSQVSGTCVKLFHLKKTWDDARTKCNYYGGDLVTIMEKQMSHFLWGLTQPDKGESYWHGLNDRRVEGSFRWLDQHTQPRYKHWGVDQPASNESDQDCGEVNRYMRSRAWSVEACTTEQKFICERYAVSPSPPTLVVHHHRPPHHVYAGRRLNVSCSGNIAGNGALSWVVRLQNKSHVWVVEETGSVLGTAIWGYFLLHEPVEYHEHSIYVNSTLSVDVTSEHLPSVLIACYTVNVLKKNEIKPETDAYVAHSGQLFVLESCSAENNVANLGGHSLQGGSLRSGWSSMDQVLDAASYGQILLQGLTSGMVFAVIVGISWGALMKKRERGVAQDKDSLTSLGTKQDIKEPLETEGVANGPLETEHSSEEPAET